MKRICSELTGGETPSVHTYRDEMEERVVPGSNSFYVGDPSPSVRSGEAISGTGCMVPQLFLLEGTDRI
jgi:hypothetical protein